MDKYKNLLKKIDKISIIFIILVALMICFSTKTHADAGYHTTYSGGSSSSHSSSSSHNSSSSSDSNATAKENNNSISNQTSTSKEIETIKENTEENKKSIESKISDLSEKIDNNSKTNLYLIIAIAVIGTISIITFIMTIIVSIKRKNK